VSQAESQRPLPIGTVVQGRYEIVAPVGQGGLGTVYRVVDVLFGRSNVYALKEQWEQSQSARKQFEREGAWLKALSHPNIPKVLEYFEWHNRLYLIMNFVEGENLERKLLTGGQLPLPESHVLGWVLPVCDALHYLHTRTPPIIHRDVKPSNIIVTPAGHSVLVDLGIAKEHAPGANATATFVRKAGTEGYAPPEQYAAAGQTGPWSDVYGLGATLYQLLTANIPPTAVERIALDAPLRQPRELNPYTSQPTNRAVMRALAIRPTDRFQSIAELKQALMAGALPSIAVAPQSPWLAAPLPAPPDVRRGNAGSAPDLPRGRRVSAIGPRGIGSGSLGRSSRPSGRLGGPEAPDDLRSERVTPSQDHKTFTPWSLAVRAALVLAVVAATVIALALVIRSHVPLDRSTPKATIQGYYAALNAQDYARAWQFTTASTKDQASQAGFTSNLRSDDSRNGRVTSAMIVSIAQDSSGNATGTVTVTRSGAPTVPGTDTIVLTQYGSVWLIDSVSSG